MKMCDIIADFICGLLDNENGIAEVQRSELAERFCCVPSQINYVISTRFSPEHGYIVESRRGGGGYIRITKVIAAERQLIMHVINAVGSEIDAQSSTAFISNALGAGVISKDESKLILSAIGEKALKPVPLNLRDEVRASIFKQILINLI